MFPPSYCVSLCKGWIFPLERKGIIFEKVLSWERAGLVPFCHECPVLGNLPQDPQITSWDGAPLAAAAAGWEEGWGHWPSPAQKGLPGQKPAMQQMCALNSCRGGLWLRWARKTVNHFPHVEMFLLYFFNLFWKLNPDVFLIHAVFWKGKTNVVQPCLKYSVFAFTLIKCQELCPLRAVYPWTA